MIVREDEFLLKSPVVEELDPARFHSNSDGGFTASHSCGSLPIWADGSNAIVPYFVFEADYG